MECFSCVLFLVAYCIWCWGMGQGSFFTYRCLFPDGTSGQDSALQCKEVQVWSLVRYLVTHMPRDVAENVLKTKQQQKTSIKQAGKSQ